MILGKAIQIDKDIIKKDKTFVETQEWKAKTLILKALLNMQYDKIPFGVEIVKLLDGDVRITVKLEIPEINKEEEGKDGAGI